MPCTVKIEVEHDDGVDIVVVSFDGHGLTLVHGKATFQTGPGDHVLDVWATGAAGAKGKYAVRINGEGALEEPFKLAADGKYAGHWPFALDAQCGVGGAQ